MDAGRLERAYRAFVHCHAVVGRASDETNLLGDVCKAAVSELGFRLAWVGLVSPGDVRVRPVAQAGYEAGYLEGLDVRVTDDERGRGPTGRAIREQRPCVVQDIARDPAFAPWREDALHRGYASSAAIPLHSGKSCIGALNLYATEPNAFDDDELALLEEMTLDLTLAVRRLRVTDARQRMAAVKRTTRDDVSSLTTAELVHDVNNMLQIVIGSIGVLQSEPRAGDPMAHLDDAMHAAQAAASMMRQFVAMSRRCADPSRPAQPDVLVLSLEPLLARLVRGVPLELSLDAMGVETRTAPLDLERILINLVINARQALEGTGKVMVSSRIVRAGTPVPVVDGELAAGTYVEIAVVDTGAGIRPDLLPKVFEPFFTTKGEAGSGLGLPSVLALARGAGGGVTIESTIGRGTRVAVLLPAEPSGS